VKNGIQWHFCGEPLKVRYGCRMLRVLCVTSDAHLMSGVTQAFPEFNFEVTQLTSLTVSATSQKWDIFILDLDTVEAGQLTSEFLRGAMRNVRKTIALVSSGRDSFRPLLMETDAVVLHSPTTAGELVLVLSRFLRPRPGSQNSCRSNSGATL
jgi:DNA-binding response OmpR family regulator